jgi:hypothetical protein
VHGILSAVRISALTAMLGQLKYESAPSSILKAGERRSPRRALEPLAEEKVLELIERTTRIRAVPQRTPAASDRFGGIPRPVAGRGMAGP